MTLDTHYSPTSAALWTGRIDDTEDLDAFRFHQAVELVDLRSLSAATKELCFCILGFRSDEGVKRNKGRVGAYEAPITIRRELAKLPANFIDSARLFDAGDIRCDDGDLDSAQTALQEAVALLLTSGYRPLVIGGGHEIVYGHYRGVRQAVMENGATSPPLLINLDAHLDLRPSTEGATSGTSFDQIAREHEEAGLPFDYICLGLQTTGNTRRLYKRADELGVQYVNEKDITQDSKDLVLKNVLQSIGSHEDVYLTLDFDVLNAANAPGVSSPQPFGMDPEVFLYLTKEILRTGKVRSVDVAEVSPRYDDDNQTAKLAAIVIYAIMNVIIGE